MESKSDYKCTQYNLINFCIYSIHHLVVMVALNRPTQIQIIIYFQVLLEDQITIRWGHQQLVGR